MNSFQCYQILGLQTDAPFKDVKSAYRSLALQYHPDKNNLEKEGKKFKTITEAYQFLRKEYKRTLNLTRDGKKHRQENINNSHFTDSKKHWWGSKDKENPPEQDWGKYTNYAESAYQDFWKYYEKAFWENYEEHREKNSNFKEAEEPSEQKQSKVNADVDKTKCIGCCSCEIIAPRVFAVDKIARINPKSSVINSAGASVERILDAAQTCPTKAISVVDQESKRQLFPW